ncbi:MAG: HAMP domain-containing histidine kinase [Alphaproteobacteria bacterium]|nr:HAMP domain-containing histidine kinase [Alphaproteobacteria bacterium]
MISQASETPTDPAEDEPPRGRWHVRLVNSLAGRLLGLTVLVVLLAEVLVFAPSLSRFHYEWLRERSNLAYVAALALEREPEADIDEALAARLLEEAGALRITLRTEGEQPRVLVAQRDIAARTIDRALGYAQANAYGGWLWAFDTLTSPEGRTLRVIARPHVFSSDVIEVVLDEAPLRRATRAYALELFAVSMLVSVVAGSLVYAVLIVAFVRPMRRMTRNIERFRKRPSDATRFLPVTWRKDEIGRAERAIRAMQSEIHASLRQRQRLAQLGGAMARVAHDLRNMLTTAQLVTHRIATSTDPEVRAAAPRLERSIGRAAGLAASALRYGRAEETPQVFQAVTLDEAVKEAFAEALAGFSEVDGRIGSGAHARVIADPDHLHRLLVNLIRNAAQAVRTASAHDPDHPRRVTVSAIPKGPKVAISVSETGCGIPQRAAAKLFEPFASGRGDGVGLGLAIARELAQAQGGELELVSTGPEGTVFQLTLPAA